MPYDFDEIIPRENTNCYKYDFREKFFGSSDLIPMWVADMDFRTPDFIIKAIRDRTQHEILGYSARGDSFFESIIGWYKRRYQWDIKQEWIISTPGVVPALHLGIRALTAAREKVIIQPPVYHPFFSLIKGNNRRILYNPLKLEGNRYRMDLKDLEEKLDDSTKLIMLSHPHNPVGRVWTAEELIELGIFCQEKDLIILSDEIHSDLIYPPVHHRPVASLNEQLCKRTITFAAASKTFNLAGLSTSIVIIPDERLRKLYSKELETSHLGMGNIFGSVALEAAYSLGDAWLDELMIYLKANLEYLKTFINEYIPGIKVIEPEATYLVWLDMKAVNTGDLTLSEFMVKQARLGFNDGPSFGEGGEGFQRINIACPRSVLIEALHRLRDAIKK